MQHALGAHDIEVDGERRGADAAEVGDDLEPLVEQGRREEFRVHDLPREPHVVAVEHLLEWKPGGPEDLGLRQLEEPYVRAVADDAGEIDVAPSDVLGDDERRFLWWHGYLISGRRGRQGCRGDRGEAPTFPR